MNRYLKTIEINKLFHLHDFSIIIEDEKAPHLILTGKNGSGKTLLLNAVKDFLKEFNQDKSLSFLNYDRTIEEITQRMEVGENKEQLLSDRNNVAFYTEQQERVFGKVRIEFDDIYQISEQIQKGEFICAFYQASRKADMVEPTNPVKPNIDDHVNVDVTKTKEFLNFLVDLKVQEALARNENQTDDADRIREWFDSFEGVLKEIYRDNDLCLQFNYKDYTFLINTGGKSFKFAQMSDGYIAAIDIIADLILKMQKQKTLTYTYQKRGIVLIDEIETHLHLELQRMILPLLTKLFPNVQFIVSTHSPFVLNSLPDAVAFDLEHRQLIPNLTEYSYESLAEGYFGVKTDSSYIQLQFEQFKRLLQQKKLSNSDKELLKSLMKDFDRVPQVVSPLIIGEYRQLLIQYDSVINTLRQYD